MKLEDRLNILEQTSKKRRLSELEEDEFFELLESSNRLDSWLDSNGVVNSSSEENIIYEDKEFLKSICEPPIPLELDKSLTYHNKGKLYRKSTIQYLLKITSSVAVIAMFIWFVIQPTKEIDLEVSTHSIVSQNLNIGDIDDAQAINEVEKIGKIEKNEIATIRVSAKDDNIEIGVKSVKIDKRLAIRTTSSALESEKPTRVIYTHKVIEPKVIDIKEETSEIVLYADAAKWQDNEQIEEMIINHEEWTDSESRSKKRLKGFVSKFANFTNKNKQI